MTGPARRQTHRSASYGCIGVVVSALLLLLAVLRTASGAPPELGLPIACTPGVDCWVVNYLDVNPEPRAATDFRCGPRSYDNHKGTDIAIRDWTAMAAGVDVVAAAAGTVMRSRDGMTDEERSEEELQRLLKANRGCGNGVLLAHEDGWRTLYCHMKQNSIVVTEGQSVRAGQKLGEVGHSGYVEFSHVHLTVFSGKELIDPFTGRSSKDGCRGAVKPLWARQLDLSYEPVSLYAAGFAGKKPDFKTLRRDISSPEVLPADSVALTFWVGLFGAREEDRITMEILDPRGQVFAHRKIVQKKDRARQFYFVGKRNRDGKLTPGIYSGSLVLGRTLEDGERIERKISRQVAIK